MRTWIAYELSKSKPGNMTPGVSKETLDAMTLEWFKRIVEKLRNGSYKFQDIRRIHIPKKPGSTDLHPLGIGYKVVQRALSMALSIVYEPTFLTNIIYSHGFRPNRGCHTALNQVRLQFANCHWVIESDIRKCFDELDHQVMLNLIARKIQCPTTLSLIESAIKAGYLNIPHTPYSNNLNETRVLLTISDPHKVAYLVLCCVTFIFTKCHLYYGLG